MNPRRIVPEQKTQLLIVPGLGGDHRMATPQLALPYEVIRPDLIEMNPGETMADYALRFAGQLLEAHAISSHRPLFIAGYSFGSAIALELVSILKPRGIILIGGLTSGSELRPLVRFFGKYVVKHVPLFAFILATPIIRFVMRRNSQISESDLDLCIAMYRAISPGFFRAAYASLANWKPRHAPTLGAGGVIMSTPLLRIHGQDDQIISCPTRDDGIVVFAGAKHLVHFARPREVNWLIQNFIDRTMLLADGEFG